MRFEYNADLEFDERVEFVAKEVMDAYPFITYENACFVGTHAIPVDDKVTNDEKFNRYYFLLRTLDRSNIKFYYVFNDLNEIYKMGLVNEVYKNTMVAIIAYANNEIKDFPELIV